MSELPEGARGRGLAVLLLVAVFGGLWAGLVVPLTDSYADRSDTIDRKTILARRMAQIAATVPSLRAHANAVQAGASVAVLDGASDALAGAALQQWMQQIGTSLGVTLANTEVLPGEQVGAYRRIGVRLAFTAHLPVLVPLMAAVSANTPRLLINDLQIQAQRSSATDSDPTLSVTMVVFGSRTGAAAQAASTQPWTRSRPSRAVRRHRDSGFWIIGCRQKVGTMPLLQLIPSKRMKHHG